MTDAPTREEGGRPAPRRSRPQAANGKTSTGTAKASSAAPKAAAGVRKAATIKKAARDDRTREALARLHHMEIVFSVSRRIAAAGSLDEILANFVDLAREHMVADRATVYLHDERTRELFCRFPDGSGRREIRIPDTVGIAGHVFRSGEGALVDDAHADKRFSRSVDEETGYRTRTLVCAPVRTVKGRVIGVVEAVNRRGSRFRPGDLELLEAIASQAAAAIEATSRAEELNRESRNEIEFLATVAEIAAERDLAALSNRICSQAALLLNAEHAVLYLDDGAGRLYPRAGWGDGPVPRTRPATGGIAGAAFTSGRTLNIPYAYADLRFDPLADEPPGHFTRSLLCVPIERKDGPAVGALQVRNKRGGTFTADDEARLRTFVARLSASLVNACQSDRANSVVSLCESVLASTPRAVVTVDESGAVASCNRAGEDMLRQTSSDLVGRTIADVFGERNAWIVERIDRARETGRADTVVDRDIHIGESVLSVDIDVTPLAGTGDRQRGTMVTIGEITPARRVRATLARYMEPELVSRLVDSGAEFTGGRSTEATVLFSDIRGFSGIAEALGPQRTIAMLNEYFAIMVECIGREGGMLDKLIGDAIMAAFGIPLPRGGDEDRALRAAIAMVRARRAWNAKRSSRGDPAIEIGIGLNTDAVISGCIGAPKRMDYTVVGDGVNLAARLENTCRMYGARILLSGRTVAKLEGAYRLRLVDRIAVKGRAAPVEIWECLDYHDERTFPNVSENIGYCTEAMAAYTRGDWLLAAETFRKAAEATPNDPLPGLYVERCETLQAAPPQGEWDGVWKAVSK